MLFLDVRGFTALAERADARELVAQLNALFDEVVPCIVEHGGHANKFVGDGLLAVFGAPDRRPDHADRALAAALFERPGMALKGKAGVVTLYAPWARVDGLAGGVAAQVPSRP